MSPVDIFYTIIEFIKQPVPEMVHPSWVAAAAFWLLVGVTFAGAAAAVFLRTIIHNVLGLATALLGVAGLYIFLNAEFLALMQVLIYIGAICISIVFAVMLSDPLYKERARRPLGKLAGALAAVVVLFLSLGTMISGTTWTAAEKVGDWSLKTVGQAFLTRYMAIFELISLVLLVAIVGSILVAGQGRKKESDQ